MNCHELDQLEKDARKPDRGSKHYKPAVMLALIKELRESNIAHQVLKQERDELKRFAYEEAPRIAAEEANKQTATLKTEVERLRLELGYIANAQRKNFTDAEEFRTWAQNRARHAIGEKPGELTIKKEAQ